MCAHATSDGLNMSDCQLPAHTSGRRNAVFIFAWDSNHRFARAHKLNDLLFMHVGGFVGSSECFFHHVYRINFIRRIRGGKLFLIKLCTRHGVKFSERIHTNTVSNGSGFGFDWISHERPYTFHTLRPRNLSVRRPTVWCVYFAKLYRFRWPLVLVSYFWNECNGKCIFRASDELEKHSEAIAILLRRE